jgi:hypothetical protein
MWGVSEELTLRLPGLRRLKRLRLSGLSLCEADLASLAGFNDLESLMIEANTLSGDALRRIRHLSGLERLHVNNLSRCSGADLAPLNGLPNLTYLTLMGQIPDTALGSLEDLSHLTSLDIHTCEPVDPQTVADLRQRLQGIEYLRLHNSTARPPHAWPPRTIRPSNKTNSGPHRPRTNRRHRR